MSQLGKAYIEVTADLKKFPAELRTKLKAALAEGLAGVEFTGFDDKAQAAGERAGEKAGQGFTKSLKKKVESANVGSGFFGFLGSLGKVFDREKERKGGLGDKITRLFSDSAETGIKAVAEKSGQLFSVASQVGSSLGSIGGQVGGILQIAAIAILIPVVLQLVGAIVQLGAVIFALPAVIGVAVAAIAPLVIAFQGVGEAIGAGFSGDMEKFKESLKGLAPSARAFVKEFVGLKSAFSAIKASVQQSFFAPLVGTLKPLATTLLPALALGLSLVSGELGNMVAGFVQLLSEPEIIGDLNDLFASTGRIIADLAPSLINLFGSFFGLLQTGLPFAERFFAALADGADSLVDFLAKAQGGGQVTGWLEKASHILGTVVGLAKDLGAYLITLFGGEIGDIGSQFLDDFRAKLQELIAYIKSPDGQETIHNLGVLFKFVGDIFLFLIGLEPAILRGFNLVFDGVRLLLKGLQALGGGFVWLISKIVDFVVWLGTGIGHGFAVAYRAVVEWAKSAGSAIGGFFTEDIPRWFGQAVDWFKALPGRIIDAISSFRDAGRSFIVDTLKSWASAVFEEIGRIIGIFLSLPYLVQQGWQRSITFLGDFFSSAWAFAVQAFWDGVHLVEAAIDAIPGLLESAGSAISGFFADLGNSIWDFLTVTLPNALSSAMGAVGDFFVGLWNNVIRNVQDTVTAGFNGFVDFLYGLPARVAALGPKLYDAAVGLGRQIASGLSSIGHFAEDLGNRVASALKSAINWVIGKINTGIAQIDDDLPVSLPRIPMLARGAVVDSPTLALVGEAGPEVVVPLGNRQRAQELAEQSGLLSMLRAPGGGRGGTTVVVYLDPTGVIVPIAKTVVKDTLNEQGDELAYARAA